MKRQTAIKHATTISNKLKKLGGIISTPECLNEALIIRRAWVFGSTAKGSESPNDLDVLIDSNVYHGIQRKDNSKKQKKRTFLCLDAELVAIKSIVKGMRMVRIHDYRIEKPFGDIDKTKVMIYPRFELIP